MRKQLILNRGQLASLAASAAALVVAPSISHGTLFAYEGFTGGQADGTALSLVSASGSGFTGNWTITSGAGGASQFLSTGLAYPVGYSGSNVASGGAGRATGAPGDNAFFRLDLGPTAFTNVSGAPKVYVSFLAQRVGTTVSGAGIISEADRTAFDLVSEYPRNFGARFNSTATGNNSLGTIGKPSDWGLPGETYPGSVPSGSDNWGVGGWKDTNAVYTNEPFSDGVDHVVVVFTKATSVVELYVNPRGDGTSDGYFDFVYTDGGTPQPLDFYAFGVEAGNNSSDRPVGDFVFDEIRIGDTWQDSAGIVPEPSTYAMMFGVLALGFAYLHRRRRS